MSEEQGSSGPPTNRPSLDGSVDLNDDLVNGSEYSLGSYVSQPSPALNKRSGSTSFRNSMDADSSFSSSAFFNTFNNHIEDKESFSPLGPNSIYELTIASDLARINRNRGPKSSVTINGGLTTVSNLRTPTTRDIPQIQLHKLSKKVNGKDLENSYVKDIADDYRSFESSYKQLTEDTLQKFVLQASDGDRRLSASSSIANFEEGAETDDISQVPAIYSNEDFRLDDPRVFKQVIENSKILTEDQDISSQLATNTDVQDKLSHYLDIVELNLIKEISKSSESFFSTLGDIEVIKSQSNQCVDLLHEVTSKLESLETAHSQTGLEILRNLRKKKEVEYLESTLLQLQYIVSIFDLANRSFNNENYSKCLNEIVVVETLIQGTEYDEILDPEIKALYPAFTYPTVNVSNLPALVHLRNDLQNLKNECSRSYINNFVDILVEDLRNHFTNVPIQDTLNRLYVSTDKSRKYSSRSLNHSYSSIGENNKKVLSDCIKYLIKSGHLTQAYSSYQERIIAEIKSIIKHNLPSSGGSQGFSSIDSSNAPSRSSSVPPESSNSQSGLPVNGGSSSQNTLSSNIKSLTPKEFETMITRTYANLSECLRRLTAHQKVLLDLALTAIPPAMSNSIDVMSLDITTCIHKAIELTQIRLTKVINVRSEQTADLPVSFYVRLYAISSAYLQECESINPGFVSGGGAGSSLSEWFKHHVSYFVHRFHSNSLKFLVNDCDREVWKEITQAETLSKCLTVLNEILGYSQYVATGHREGFSGDSWLEILDFFQDDSKKEVPQEATDSSITRLTVGSESFLIPDLVRKSLTQIRDYIIISKVFPGTTSLIENNLLNYFKLMNSKTSQAVLNAGATRTAGLKHITTRHLALCIQLVEFNIELLNSIQNIFPRAQREVSPTYNSQNTEELNFTRIISNYKDHENELFTKLVSIMYDRTAAHCAAVLKIDFSQPIKPPNQSHPYMETLVKDTLTISKVLFKYLPELKCSLILSQVFDNYKKSFIECFCVSLPQFKDFNEKHSLLKDIDYFRVKLSELPGYGNSGQVIWENVNALPTEEDMKMEEIMRNNIKGEREQSEANSRKTSMETTRAAQSETSENVPETVPEVPEAPEAIPETVPKGPEPISEPISEVPEPNPEVPEKVPDVTETVPETVPEIPEIVPEAPETVPEAPETAPEVKEILRNNPEAVSEIPVESPTDLKRAEQCNSKTSPEALEKESEVSKPMPELPKALPEVSEIVFEVPENIPNVPEPLPEVPKSEPKVPELEDEELIKNEVQEESQAEAPTETHDSVVESIPNEDKTKEHDE